MKLFYPLILQIIAAALSVSYLSQVSDKQKEFDEFIQNLENEFIYYEEKKEIIKCIKSTYRDKVDTISHPYYKVLFYENILNELYDSHINLNTNTNGSYRLTAPIYTRQKDGKFFVSNVFSSQLNTGLNENIIDAEILSFNAIDFQQAIDNFPTYCHDKKVPKIREWLANKVLSGRRDQPRVLELKLANGKRTSLNLDSLELRNETTLLTSEVLDNVGLIRINNSLGNPDLTKAFDNALNNLSETDALILDLRNTPGGGNTSVAEPILGRFISQKTGYQVCENKNEKYTRFVLPRGKTYSNPLYILVGRWTGSMGEGITIGLDGMQRATIIGTEMNRLAGGMKTINFLNSNFGYRISFEKMYHLDGTLRENFVPDNYVEQQNAKNDDYLNYALGMIKNR